MQFLTCPSTAITGILTPSFQTLEIQPYLCTHWNSHLILPNVWILAPFYKHWNFDRIPSHFGILALFFTDWNFQLILPSIWILPYSYKHWNSYLIVSLETLKFWPYPSKQWNFGPIFIYTGFLILTFKILGFWPYFYKHWNYDLLLPKNEIRALFL